MTDTNTILEKENIDMEEVAEELEELEEIEELVEDFSDFDNFEINSDLYADDNYKIYLRQIENYPLLSREEEVDLFTRMKNGDDEARIHIFNCNLKLVVYIVEKKIVPFTAAVNKLDLIQEGNFGLMIAMDRFDISKGFKFSTYAYQWIFQKITRYYQNNGTTIRIPCHAHTLLGKLKKLNDQFMLENMREPNSEELDVLISDNMTSNIVENLLDAVNAKNVDSLNKIIISGEHADDDLTLESNIADKGPSIETMIINKNEAEILREVMNLCLNDREKYVLTKRFGLEDGISRTLEVVGKDLNITRERVRQIESKAIRKLRRPLIRRGIHFFDR